MLAGDCRPAHPLGTVRDVGDPVLVELEEDPGARPGARAGRAHGRRWVALPAVLVAVLVAGLVVGQVVTDARERARVAAVADLPDVLDPLPRAPGVAWRLDADATGDVAVVGTALVEGRVADDGAVSVTARDVRTGDVRWTVPLLDAPSTPARPGTTRYGVGCADGPGLPGRVVCLAHDATAVRAPDGDASTARGAPATGGSVVVVDTATGAEAVRFPAVDQGDVAASAGVVGDVVVLAAPRDDGTSVWAVDPVTGRVRWRVHADTGFGGGWLRWGEEVRVVPVGDDAVAVLGAGAVVLDVGDGATLATAGTLATVLGARHDGAALVVGSEGYTRLVGPDADVRLDGAPVRVTLDDGSVPGLALTTAGGLRAWDAATGTPRWRADVTARTALVAGGCVHVHDGTGVTTLDARTGEVRWQVTAATLLGGDVVTTLASDGTRLLVAGLDASGTHGLLAAVDPTDGGVLWRADLPRDVGPVDTVDGVLLGVTPQDTVVLR